MANLSKHKLKTEAACQDLMTDNCTQDTQSSLYTSPFGFALGTTKAQYPVPFTPTHSKD